MRLSETRQATIKSCIGVLLSVLLYFSSGFQFPVLDSSADTYFKDSITKAGVSYGVCRVINAAVSVLQESSVQLEPAGIGLSLAVGQIVDPINDMVERLSGVLVMSIASLGVQELAYEISLAVVPLLMAVTLLIISLLAWFTNSRVARLRRIMAYVLVIASIARFCLPVSSLANEFLQENFFDAKIMDANRKLAASTSELKAIENLELPKAEGIIGTIGNSASYLREKSMEFKNTIQVFMENKGEIIENLLRLTFLYLGIFIIQVLMLPLLIFWFLLRMVNSLVMGAAITT
jgi:hypothetical protein